MVDSASVATSTQQWPRQITSRTTPTFLEQKWQRCVVGSGYGAKQELVSSLKAAFNCWSNDAHSGVAEWPNEATEFQSGCEEPARLHLSDRGSQGAATDQGGEDDRRRHMAHAVAFRKFVTATTVGLEAGHETFVKKCWSSGKETCAVQYQGAAVDLLEADLQDQQLRTALDQLAARLPERDEKTPRRRAPRQKTQEVPG